MTVEYFGYNVDATSTAGLSTYTVVNNDAVDAFVCPGSGKYNLVELAIRSKAYDVGGNVRVAIYDTSGNLIAQGNAEISVTDTSNIAWYTHTSFTDSAGNPVTPQLDGGTHYLIAATADGASGRVLVAVGTALTNCRKYSSNDYTGGFPSTYTPSSLTANRSCLRAGVEAAPAGGSAIPVIMNIYRQFRR